MATPPTLPDHLVVVCGHGIWLGGPARGHDEAEWLIESYKSGETPTFVAHIRAGLEVLADDARAVVAFSGGPTRPETRLSEGRSYANLAAANDYFGLLPAAADGRAHPLSPVPLHPRVLVEEQALDSYYNILFSLLAFWRHVDGLLAKDARLASSSTVPAARWPSRLTIVSHGFKRTRLVDSHCGADAIAFLPLAPRVSFIGINPPNLPAGFGGDDGNGGNDADGVSRSTATTDASSDGKRTAMQGAVDVIGHWAVDPHGIGALLAGKRRARNPWACDQRLFGSEAERRRCGIETQRVGGEGGDRDGVPMEALAANSPRPWNEAWTAEQGR